MAVAEAAEGAAVDGEFLRHVERTRMLVFVVDVASENPRADLEVLMKEIGSYSPALLERPRLVALSKADLLEANERDSAPARVGLPEAHLFSSLSGFGMRELLESCWSTIVPVAGREEYEA